MVSLWGSKNDDDENEEGQDGTRPQSASHSHPPEDANERTRLLHPPPHAPNRGDGYLDPDDPAVGWPAIDRAVYANGPRYLLTISGLSEPSATLRCFSL